MLIDRRAVLALRVFLIALVVLLALFQTMSLPGQFAHMADEDPDHAYLRWPLTAITIFWALCAQVVAVSTWRLLTLVLQDQIFSDASRRWVDAMVWAFGAGWVSVAGLTAFIFVIADDPGLPLLLTLLTVVVGAGALLMTVMRSLLRRAIDMRVDIEAVI